MSEFDASAVIRYFHFDKKAKKIWVWALSYLESLDPPLVLEMCPAQVNK
jgi:hypothetical protein